MSLPPCATFSPAHPIHHPVLLCMIYRVDASIQTSTEFEKVVSLSTSGGYLPEHGQGISDCPAED